MQPGLGTDPCDLARLALHSPDRTPHALHSRTKDMTICPASLPRACCLLLYSTYLEPQSVDACHCMSFVRPQWRAGNSTAILKGPGFAPTTLQTLSRL